MARFGYKAEVRRSLFLIAVLSLPGSAIAAAGSVAIINGTSTPMTKLQIRPVGEPWRPLVPGLSPGARTLADLSGENCIFDLRGEVAGSGVVGWNRLNLCEATSVTLNRQADGTSWADYD
jgi:hypothetical protein